MKKWLSLGMLLVQSISTPLLLRYAATETAQEQRFSSSVAVTLQELLKVLLSLALFLHEVGWQLPLWWTRLQREVLRDRTTLKLAIPAGLYFIQNLALQITAANLPAASMTLLGQGTKIMMVAVCSVLILHRSLSKVQWFSLVLLVAGLCLVQSDSGREGSHHVANSGEQSASKGLLLLLGGNCCSAWAGVYFEKMLKKPAEKASVEARCNADDSKLENSEPLRTASIWVTNVQLALFSFTFGVMHLLVTHVAGVRATSLAHSGGASNIADLFRGFTGHTWLMVLNNAVGGILVAAVLKYADNMLKGFATALATLATAVLSVPVFGFEIGKLFAVGAVCVVLSTLLFGGEWSRFGKEQRGKGADSAMENDSEIPIQDSDTSKMPDSSKSSQHDLRSRDQCV